MHKDTAYKWIRLGFATAAICIGFFVIVSYINMRQSIKESQVVDNSLQNLFNLAIIHTELEAMERNQKNFILSGDPQSVNTFQKNKKNIQTALAALSLNDTLNIVRRNALVNLINKKFVSSAYILSLKGTDTNSQAFTLKLSEGESLIQVIKNRIYTLQDSERNLLKVANTQSRNAAKTTAWQFLCVAIFFYLIFYYNYTIIISDFKRKQVVNEQLKFSASLLKSISDPIITTDKDLKITNWNKYAEEIYGWKENEVLGKTMKDMLGTRYADSDYETNLSLFLKEGRWKGEVMHTHKDGHTLYVSATTTAIKNDAGEYVGGVVVIRDITERKNIEQQLHLLTGNLEKEVKEKVAELNEVFERITDAFIALDNNWCYTYVNEKAAAMHNLLPADLIGRNIWDLFPDVVNEDFYTALHKARETMKPLKLELYYSRTGQWFEDLIYPSANGISVYYHDVTDKKKIELDLQDAESKFRNLVEESSVGVYIVQNERFVYANPFFADIFGYTPEELIADVKMLDLVYSEDRDKVLGNIQSRMNSEIKSMHYEFDGVTKNGDVINVEVFGTLMLYKGEQAIIGTIIDITGRKKANLQLQASEENLRLSNERFTLVAKATNDAIWDWDLRTNTIQGNETFVAIYNIGSNEALSYDAFISRIHPDDAPAILENYQQALENKRTYLTEEFRLLVSDGSYRIISDKAYILYDENGEPYRMLGAMQDITLQKTGQQQLLIEKELSDSIINSLPGIFYLYNKEGKFYRWNKNFEVVTGYTAEEINHLHPLDLFPEKEKALLTEKINNVFLTGSDSVEAHFLTKYNDEIYYHFTGMVIHYEGEECLMGSGFDLSERVKAQKQLVESEEKFRTLIEQASDGIFISNQLGDYLVVNSSAVLLTGYTKDELLKMNMQDIMLEQNHEPSIFRMKGLLTGQAIITDKLLRQKSGNLVHVEISNKLLPDGRFQGIVRDITARKWAEEGLRYSEEKRRLIMNAALDAIICMDIKGEVTFWNAQAEKIFGYKAAEVYGLNLSGLIIPEKYRHMHDEGMEHYLKTGEGNVFNKILELTAINRLDIEFPIELTVLPIKQGNEEFFCAFVRDITSRKIAAEELRSSEHKYRLLFEQNPMPMWMISLPEKNFLAVNAAAVEFYGYTKNEFLTMNIKDIRPVEEEQSVGNVIDTYKAGISNTGIWAHKKKMACW